jgi:hypothetical protein
MLFFLNTRRQMVAQQPPQVMKWLTVAPMFCFSTLEGALVQKIQHGTISGL